MRIYDVILAEQAEKDLDGIFEYIASLQKNLKTQKDRLPGSRKQLKALRQCPKDIKHTKMAPGKIVTRIIFRSIIIMFSIQWTMYLIRFPYLGLCTVPEISMPSCFTTQSISRLSDGFFKSISVCLNTVFLAFKLGYTLVLNRQLSAFSINSSKHGLVFLKFNIIK